MTPLEALRQLQSDLAALKRTVRDEPGDRISRAGIRMDAERVASKWFQEVRPMLNGTAASEAVERYSAAFQRLIRISAPNNRKSSYEQTLEVLTKKFRADLILPLQTTPPQAAQATSFDALFAALGESDEDAYLRRRAWRRSASFGWCSTATCSGSLRGCS